MPKVGKEEFAYTPEGMAEAEAYSEATGIPVSNAMERVQNYQLGGLVGGRIPGSLGRGGRGGVSQDGVGLLPKLPTQLEKGGKVHKKGYKK